jgi:membrane protein DedA with SNARE-associated domain
VSALGGALGEHGPRLVALNVFLQQIGAPLPAEPTLVVAGSLAARGRLSVAGVVGAALGAALVADLTWFVVGRRFGARALRVVLSRSSTPEKHLSQVQRLFARWGPAAFALAKFIPGVPMVGPVLAGGLGTTLPMFVLWDVLAMALWAGIVTGLGMVFQRHVELALGTLDRLGGWSLILAGAGAVVVGVALRLWRQHERRGALTAIDETRSVKDPISVSGNAA